MTRKGHLYRRGKKVEKLLDIRRKLSPSSVHLPPDSDLVSHVGVHEKQALAGDKAFRIGGICEVCVHPNSRGKGYVKSILKRIHVLLSENGVTGPGNRAPGTENGRLCTGFARFRTSFYWLLLRIMGQDSGVVQVSRAFYRRACAPFAAELRCQQLTPDGKPKEIQALLRALSAGSRQTLLPLSFSPAGSALRLRPRSPAC